MTRIVTNFSNELRGERSRMSSEHSSHLTWSSAHIRSVGVGSTNVEKRSARCCGGQLAMKICLSLLCVIIWFTVWTIVYRGKVHVYSVVANEFIETS